MRRRSLETDTHRIAGEAWYRRLRVRHVRDGSWRQGWGRLHCFYRTKVAPWFEPYRGWDGPRCRRCHRPAERFHDWATWNFLNARKQRGEQRHRVLHERRRRERRRLGRESRAERKARRTFLRDLRQRKALRRPEKSEGARPRV